MPADRARAAGGGHPAAAVLAAAPEEEADAPGARRQNQAAVAQGAAAGALFHARRQPSTGECESKSGECRDSVGDKIARTCAPHSPLYFRRLTDAQCSRLRLYINQNTPNTDAVEPSAVKT